MIFHILEQNICLCVESIFQKLIQTNTLFQDTLKCCIIGTPKFIAQLKYENFAEAE